MSETTRTEYRIESKRPGSRRWEYVHFTGAVGRTREEIDRNLIRAEQQASQPGWLFRVMERTVTITASEWVPSND